MKIKFQIGDRIRCIRATQLPLNYDPGFYYICSKDSIYSIVDVTDTLILIKDKDGEQSFQDADYFEKIVDESKNIHENVLPITSKEHNIYSAKHNQKYKYENGVFKGFDKNKCGHTNYERKELGMEKDKNISSRRITINEDGSLNKPESFTHFITKNKKEEFKIEKLGWYEDTNRNKFKVIHALQCSFIAVSEDNTMKYLITENGNDCNMYGIQLIKYLGSELSKEPRIFEFVVTENDLKHFCPNETGTHFKQLMIIPDIENIKENKWHITMKEIIE